MDQRTEGFRQARLAGGCGSSTAPLSAGSLTGGVAVLGRFSDGPCITCVTEQRHRSGPALACTALGDATQRWSKAVRACLRAASLVGQGCLCAVHGAAPCTGCAPCVDHLFVGSSHRNHSGVRRQTRLLCGCHASSALVLTSSAYTRFSGSRSGEVSCWDPLTVQLELE